MILHILPGNPPPDFKNRETYNRAYSHYKKTWERLFNRPGRPKRFDVMGFFRQSYLFHVEDRGGVVAQTFATHYHLDNKICEDLAFFEKFLGEPMDWLKNNNLKSCLSLEFSSVSREYSPRLQQGVNFYRIIFLLAVRYAKNLCVDAVIGHPRRVTQTNSVLNDLGCRTLKSGENKYGVGVDIEVGVLSELKMTLEPMEQKIFDSLWESRLDSLGLSTGEWEAYGDDFLKPSPRTLKEVS